MCDTVSASILFGALSLLPDNRYILMGLVSTSGIVHIVNRERPSNRLDRVEVAIKSVEETLEQAIEGCARNHLEFMDLTSSLFEAKLSASKIRTRMLDMPSVAKYTEFVQYVHYVRDIMQDIAKCAKKLEELRTKALRIIEAQRQRQFSANIPESREIFDTPVLQPRDVVALDRESLAIYPTIPCEYRGVHVQWIKFILKRMSSVKEKEKLAKQVKCRATLSTHPVHEPALWP
ncbi:hypothetical protein K438DRAFT_1940741 [Mycena galopus ATCC 62051]|nr:hypothetical protein K438DRAFT_1940741 [Mycena galopus ATCC 62051]